MSFKPGALHKTTPHLFADLLELLLLTNADGRAGYHKNEIGDVAERLPVAAEDLDWQPARPRNDENGAEVQDRQERYIEDLWRVLEYRAAVMGAAYPFRVGGGRIDLERALDTPQTRIYRLLVSCSRLRSFPNNGCRQRWAAAFTSLCAIAFRSMVPSHASVRIFDANSVDRREYYDVDLRRALVKLGEDLQPEMINMENCAKVSASGDAGLDLVAIVPFGDDATTVHALFAQCGAQETDWPSKVLEAHPIAFRSYYQFLHEPANVMFIPLSYRGPDGKWVDSSNVSGCIVIDRERIFRLVERQNLDELVAAHWFTQFETEFTAVTQPEPQRTAVAA
ncbi:hypothetical protein [Paraburkholderia phytofirmans]|uniref:Uncharacterized protein n=1 Tax=Paraburkholderia phytofirmans (strain DSM 17436 / LMG 22146 / PsJN) TaxID=398527 RepID=B2T1V9_PARPJ|nr:hypothetical protein [Paraburkholderia phytofirmans]ACD15570.1 hypothetical protein Bphyt_1154 [Paraburkholderia phytofirmans PsJN]